MAEGIIQRQSYLRHQAMVMIHVTPTPRYPEMGIIKILRTTREYDYIIVRDVGNAGRMREVMEDGKVDLRGMNLLFVSTAGKTTEAVVQMVEEGGLTGVRGYEVIGDGADKEWTLPKWQVLDGKSPWEDGIVDKM